MKILVIDDEVALKDIYLAFLAKADASAKFCDHPQKGWQAIEKEEFDLIITDLKMPIISGEELVTIVRSSRLNALTPIILCSAHINKLVMTEMSRESKIYFLNKPFDSNSLLELVKKAVPPKKIEIAENPDVHGLWLEQFAKKIEAVTESKVELHKVGHFEVWNFETIGINFAIGAEARQMNVTLLMKLKTFFKLAGKIRGTQYIEIEPEILYVWQELINNIGNGDKKVTFSKVLSKEFLTLPEQHDAFYKVNTSVGEVLAYLN